MKTAAWLLLGLAASLAASRALPVAAGDPLRETLVWMPALAAAFFLLERTKGARRLPARTRAAETIALFALAGLAIARPHLGFRFSAGIAAPLLMAGLVCLLAHRVARQLVALRPLLGSRLPPRPAAAFFWLPFLAYLALVPWASSHRPPDGDEPYYLLIAHSLAYDLDAELANNYAAQDYRAFVDRALEPQPGDPVGRGGEQYSRHNLLLPLLLALPYRLAGLRGAQAALCALAAALVWATLRLARHYVAERPGPALLATAVLAFSAPLLLFSYQAWVEVAAALAAVVGLDGLRSATSREGAPRAAWAAVLAALLLLPLLKLRFAPVAAGLLLLALLRARQRRAALGRLVLALALVLAAILAFNAVRFGNPLKYQSFDVLHLYAGSVAAYVRGASGLFYDCAFGLFAVAPLWLLLLPALLLRPLRLRALLLDALLLCGPYLLAIVPRGEWYGAWSPPFRYGMVVLPFLALLLAPALADRRRAGPRALLEGLGLVTLLLTVLWAVRPEWTFNHAHGRNHVLDFLSQELSADAARLVPSVVRPRAATSWWPLATLAAVPLLWRLGRRPSRAHGWGAAAALVAFAAFLAAAGRLPTRIVELEDVWLARSGGELYPEPWVLARLRFRGAWALPNRATVTVPVVPGGQLVRIVVEARKLRPAALAPEVALAAARTPLGRVELTDVDDWQRLTLGPVKWPPPARELRVSLPPVPEPAKRSGALIDRIVLEWLDE